MTIDGGYKKYGEVSFMRGFAITTVVLMHLLQVFVRKGDIPLWLRFFSSLGGTGGHLFIFCSGFGLYLSYLNKPVSFGEFLKRRFLKIYIPYILFLLIEFCLPQSESRAMLLPKLLSHIFLYKMFFETYTISFGLQFWFLSTILQLYLLFVPICKLKKRVSSKTLFLLSLGLSVGWWILMRITGLEAKRIWGSFFLQYLWEFVFGMIVAEHLFHRSHIYLPLKLLWIVAITGLSLQAFMAFKGGWFSAFNDIPALFGYGSTVLLLWHYGGYLFRKVLLWVDGISYEWFLVHTAVFSRCYALFRDSLSSELLLAITAVLISVAAAWLYEKLIRQILRRIPS